MRAQTSVQRPGSPATPLLSLALFGLWPKAIPWPPEEPNPSRGILPVAHTRLRGFSVVPSENWVGGPSNVTVTLA